MSEQRDIELTAAPENTIDSSGRRVIAVIGIDRYQGWRRLTNAVRDARGAAALFGQLGFESVTEPLFDDRATGKAIHELVTDDLRTLCADDSLVLFYAGHGGTRTHPLGSQVVKTGYLIPVDASDRAATWIELDGWLRAVSLLPAMHILVILDACHSGIALGPIIKWRDGGTWQTTPLSTLKARRSRRIITSALDDQVALDSGPVYGHSLFTGCLIEGLTHGFGSAGNRLTTGSELGLYLQRRVETHPNSRQTPDFGTFDFDDRGEMVIPFVIEQPSEPPELVGVEGDRLGHPNGVTVDEGTELLAEIGPAKPRLIVAVAVVVALLVVGVIAFRPLSQSAPAGCPTPSLDPNAVWSDEKRQRLASRRDAEARMLDVDFAAWQAARTRMCSAGVVAQSLRHACLDAVLVRFDVIARAVEGLASDVPTTDLGAFAIDPVVCEAARPPRLAPAATPLLREVVATALREAAVEAPYRRDEATELVHRVADEPCAAALARLLLAEATPLASERLRELSEAEQDAERCNDDRVRAEVAVGAARHALTSGTLGTAISAKVKSADVAVERVAQRDLTADVDSLRLETARRADHLDEAIARGEAAVAGYAARGRIAAQLAIGLDLLDLRDLRAGTDDVAAVPRLYGEWRGLAARELGEEHPMVRKIDRELAWRMFAHGDVAGGHARLDQLWRPIPGERARSIRGRVVDRRGAPVEGATVMAGRRLVGDAISAAVPFPRTGGGLRRATTGKTGEFEIPDAPPEGVVIAQLGDARSRPAALADTLTLRLEPTSRIEGRIDLRGEPSSRVLVLVEDLRLPVSTPYELLAPVAPDGSFAVEGVARAQVRVFAMLQNPRTRSYASTTVDVRGPVVRGLAIAVARSKRVVHVIVRSTVEAPVGNALVYVFPGRRASTNALEMSRELRSANERLALQIEGEHAPPPVVGRARAGDMFATMNEVPEGAATACAIGFPTDLGDRDLDSKINANLAKIEVRCEPIPADAEVAVVEVPPWPRLD